MDLPATKTGYNSKYQNQKKNLNWLSLMKNIIDVNPTEIWYDAKFF